jgi:hypothetical protein
VSLIAGLAWILISPASRATEVVWLRPPTDAVAAAALGVEAGAERGPLTPLDLRVAASDATAADVAAIRGLTEALRDVHQFDTRLDGELLIMNELEPAISRVSLLRDAADRDALFAALAYEGFAVDRFFAGELATDDRAAPQRVTIDGKAWIRPWLDAIALDPSHVITPYDVAEAPQRVDFGRLRDDDARLLPAVLNPVVPADVALRVDGVDVDVGPSGALEVRPGRHLVAAVRGGRVLQRWDVRLAPTERADLALDLPDTDFKAWIASFATGTPAPPPPALGPALAALGGSVWVVAPDVGPAGSVFEVGPAGVVAHGGESPPDKKAREAGDLDGGLVAAVALGGGWAGTWDFYEQDPTNVPATAAAVNAPSLGGSVDLGWRAGWIRVGAGVDALYTVGAYHVAAYGDNETRLRPYPHVELGIPWVQGTVGYVFPHNAGLGLQGEIPLAASPLDLRLASIYGVRGARTRPDGSDWTGRPLIMAWGGVELHR